MWRRQKGKAERERDREKRRVPSQPTHLAAVIDCKDQSQVDEVEDNEDVLCEENGLTAICDLPKDRKHIYKASRIAVYAKEEDEAGMLRAT